MNLSGKTGNGRGWAYASLFLMGGLSIAGNIAHTYMIIRDPDALDVILAAGWPIGLFFAIEMFARLPWQRVVSHNLVRYGGLTLVATLTGVVSYDHLHGLLNARGQGGLVSIIGPLAVDGIMAMATMGLVLTRAIVPTSVSEDTNVDAEIARLERLMAEQMLEDAMPISPAPVPVSPAPAGVRRPRASWDARLVAEMAIAGAKAREISEKLDVPTATASRFTRVARMLTLDPRADIPAEEKVHPEHVQLMRELVAR